MLKVSEELVNCEPCAQCGNDDEVKNHSVKVPECFGNELDTGSSHYSYDGADLM